MLTEPRHSLIHQSFHSEERREPLNGDGSGIAWYAPHISSRPALFKDVMPAWSNENLLEIARVTMSHCIFAHVRAASPHSPVHRLNCHPFAHGDLALMHNGSLAGFERYRRALLARLSDEAFSAIHGSTDSEHAFALLIDHYAACTVPEPLERLAMSLEVTIHELEELRTAAGVNEPSSFNFAATDGTCIVASRYSSGGPSASLYFATARGLDCEHGHYKLDFGGEHNLVVIASERLAETDHWTRVPEEHLVLAREGTVEMRPIERRFASESQGKSSTAPWS